MSMNIHLQSLDMPTKVLIVILAIFVSYFLAMFTLKPIIMAGATPTHSTVMGDHIMNFASPEQQQLNILSIIIALVVGLGVSLLVRTAFTIGKKEAMPKEEELRIVKKVLSPDEKLMLDEIEKAGEITQDSLRFRLGWSKAKISAILLTLDKMDLVQRERQGKTYNVFIRR